MPHPQQDLLDRLGIKTFDTDPRLLTRKRLAALFGAKTSGRIILRKLVRSVIWHVHQGIQSDRVEAIESNIRSFFYLWLKPVLSHLAPKDLPKSADPYKALTEELTRLVLDEKLMLYSDFDFTDENFEHRRIGTSLPHVLVFAEKRGWIRLLRRFHKDLGCSVLALGGSPSSLTSEYTWRDIKHRLDKHTPPIDSGPDSLPKIQLIGIVDYDPSGHTIASSFREQLQLVGAPVARMDTIIHPDHYTPQEVAMFAFSLPPHHKTRNQTWMDQTGGIHGNLQGLEAESLPFARVRKLVQILVDQVPPLNP